MLERYPDRENSGSGNRFHFRLVVGNKGRYLSSFVGIGTIVELFNHKYVLCHLLDNLRYLGKIN